MQLAGIALPLMTPFIAVLFVAIAPVHSPLAGQAASELPPASPPATLGRLSGIAYDSTTARPLTDAEIALARGDDLSQLRTTRSDAEGRFYFDSLAPGPYLAGATHARLDSLGIGQLTLLVSILNGVETSTTLSVPSIKRLIVESCGVGALADSSGMMIGTLRLATPDRRAVVGAVRAAWSEVALTSRGFETSRPYRQVETNTNGRFIICSAPSGGLMSVRAWRGADSSGFVDVNVPADGLLLRDLYVSGTNAGESTHAQFGALRGRVYRPDQKPLDDVRLALSSNDVEVVSDANGNFLLAELPPGTHALEARAVGYAPNRMTVDIVGGEVATVSIAMEKFIALDPVLVRADRLMRMRGLEDFNERSDGGFGYFLNPLDIAKRNPMRVSDLLRRIPGIVIMPSRGVTGGDRVMMRGGAGMGTYCVPQFFVDGARISMANTNIDNLLFANDVRAVEVYNRSTITPPQFYSLDGCGAVIVWTGPRG